MVDVYILHTIVAHFHNERTTNTMESYEGHVDTNLPSTTTWPVLADKFKG